MSMVLHKEATCKKCGNKQQFWYVVSWNFMFGEMPNFENKCERCKNQLTMDDISEEEYKLAKRNIDFISDKCSLK